MQSHYHRAQTQNFQRCIYNPVNYSSLNHCRCTNLINKAYIIISMTSLVSYVNYVQISTSARVCISVNYTFGNSVFLLYVYCSTEPYLQTSHDDRLIIAGQPHSSSDSYLYNPHHKLH